MAKQEDMLMSMDDFGNPKVIRDLDLINLKLMRLILLEPGTHPDIPEKGFGLISRYRYIKAEDIPKMEVDLLEHINKWVPNLRGVDVTINLKNSILNIGIAANEVFYEYTYDGRYLRNVTLSDIEEGV